MKHLIKKTVQLIFFLMTSSGLINLACAKTELIINSNCEYIPTSCPSQISQVNLNISTLTGGNIVNNFPLMKGGRYRAETYINQALFIVSAQQPLNCEAPVFTDALDRIICRNSFSETVTVLLENIGSGKCQFIGQNGTICNKSLN